MASQWTEVATVASAAFAMFSAIAGLLTVREARRSVLETRKLAQASLMSELLDEFNSDEMLNAMVCLRLFKDEHGNEFANKFALKRRGSWDNIRKLDGDRRKVKKFFQKIYKLWKINILGNDFVKGVITYDQLRFCFDVVIPLEIAINSRFDRRAFDELSEIFDLPRNPPKIVGPTS